MACCVVHIIVQSTTTLITVVVIPSENEEPAPFIFWEKHFVRSWQVLYDSNSMAPAASEWRVSRGNNGLRPLSTNLRPVCCSKESESESPLPWTNGLHANTPEPFRSSSKMNSFMAPLWSQTHCPVGFSHDSRLSYLRGFCVIFTKPSSWDA